jgi:cytochrome b561
MLAWFVYAAVALHIAATLWHAVVMRDGTLARMWPRSGNLSSQTTDGVQPPERFT